MGTARKYTAWGTVVGTKAASIDLVLMEATRPLMTDEIVEEIRRRGLPVRGAVYEHLNNTLKNKRGHIVNTPNGWCRVELLSNMPDSTVLGRSGEEKMPARLAADESDRSEPLDDGDYTPDETDRRSLVERHILARRGRQKFRDALRARYQDRCAVTGCQIVDILEAAHIVPYRGESDNHVTNGLLLRADIHTLFDLNLLGIEPLLLRVKLHQRVAVEYARFDDKPLVLPKEVRPSQKSLQIRYDLFRQSR